MQSEPDAPSHVPLRQSIASIVLALALVLAGLWILREFLVALVWACIFAIALWPLYVRLLRLTPGRFGGEAASALMVTVVAVVFILPLVLLGVAVARETHYVIEFINGARQSGIPAPDWLTEIPRVGGSIGDWWRANLGDPTMVQELFGRLNARMLAQSAREYGGEIAHRLILFAFTLLTLFFLFREGAMLAAQIRGLSDRMLGRRGERMATQMVAAVHGTVVGLVLVGLAEGLVLGIVYFFVGLPYPASVGAVTGVAAVIPFAAPTVFCVAGLYLVAQGQLVGAMIILAAGFFVVFIADHVVRPVLIGGAARLPFLWVLLGILGGVETLGFLGLFVGPAVMAALVSLWRDWTETLPGPGPGPGPGPEAQPPPTPRRRRVSARRAGGRRS
ncbi:MAG TPA: AI-2E family transporter [Stellaceae bacterium]|jgi:predicted PurR-regulated permease PerM|nr:AI-2E family transporter [Stellaceae bacterium]